MTEAPESSQRSLNSALRRLAPERLADLFAQHCGGHRPPPTATQSFIAVQLSRTLSSFSHSNLPADVQQLLSTSTRRPSGDGPPRMTKERKVVELLREAIEELGTHNVHVDELERRAAQAGIDITELTPYKRRGRDAFVARMAGRLGYLPPAPSVTPPVTIDWSGEPPVTVTTEALRNRAARRAATKAQQETAREPRPHITAPSPEPSATAKPGGRKRTKAA